MAAVLLLTACGGGGPGSDGFGVPLHHPVTRQELRTHPEAALLFPGSVRVRAIGADEHAQAGEAEPDPAYAGVVATASASAGELLRWYDQRFAARGYRRAPYYRQSNQSSGAAWSIPDSREQIQVGVYAPGALVAGAVAAGHIAYEELLVSYRVTGPPPP